MLSLSLTGTVLADDQALWREYGLVRTETGKQGKLHYHHLPDERHHRCAGRLGMASSRRWALLRFGCILQRRCETNRRLRTTITWLCFDGGIPKKAQVDALLKALPNKRDTSLPAILTFLPQQRSGAGFRRYVLGPASLQAFAPELASANPGFDQGAEAQLPNTSWTTAKPGSFGNFRLSDAGNGTSAQHRLQADSERAREALRRAGRRGVWRASDAQADTLLSRVQYEAKITWNETPPPSPIKPLYQLLMNIMYLSIVLSAVCLLAGLMYAGMRIYRRRYGTLEADEAMTTLHLTGE